MRIAAIFGACLFLSCSSYAEDYFVGQKAVDIPQNKVVDSTRTIGGYPIYKSDGAWKFAQSSSREGGALGNAEAINRGRVVLYEEDIRGGWLATMVIMANLSTSGLDQYMLGAPCSGTHTVAVQKSRGTSDNCMTIDVQSDKVGESQKTFFVVNVTQTGSGGRNYYMALILNAEPLVLHKTLPADWTPEAIKSDPARQAFMLRMQTWAEALQDGAARALDWSKPQDAFDKVPSYKTLVANP